MLLVNFVAVLVVLVVFRSQLQRATDAVRASQLAFTGMLDQETGLRGYIITGERQFLQPYVLGQSEVRIGNIALLAAGMRGAAGSQILQLQLAEQLWETTWASVAASGEFGPRSSLPNLSTFLLAGKHLFDADRVQQTKLDTILTAQQDSATRAETDALAASIIVAALLFVWLALVMRRQRVILAEAIVHPVNDVLERVDRIREGDMGEREPIVGPIELQRVGAGLAAMAERLEAGQILVQQRERELAEYAGDLRTILRAAREVAGSFNLDYVLDAVASAAVAVTRLPRATVWLSEDDRLVARHDTGADDPRQPNLKSEKSGYGRVGQAARFGRSVGSDEVDSQADAEVAMAVPMVVGGHVVGVIDTIGPSGYQLPSQRLQALETLATHAATAVEAAKLHTATERLSRTDALTQLANRRQLDTDLSTEVERAARYRRPLALIMLDVDHFKEFNDTHGHQRGDEVLALFARVLSDELRSTDTAYRYGGEEFCVLVREATEEAAGLLAERVRQRMQQRMEAKLGSQLTASFGVAQLTSGMEASGLVGLADTALYRAKAAGRNRVVLASEKSEPS